jgi:hypothetical protein
VKGPEPLHEAAPSRTRDTSERRNALTEDVASSICASVANGLYRIQALRAAGCTKNDWDRWLREAARSPGSETAVLVERIEESEAKLEEELTKSLMAGRPEWKARAFLLERRFRKRWAPPRVDVQAEIDKRVASERAYLLGRIQQALTEADYQRIISSLGLPEHKEGG